MTKSESATTAHTFTRGQRVVILRGKFKGEVGIFYGQVGQRAIVDGIVGLRAMSVKSIAAV